jgi:hypothetical protein
MLHAPKRKRTTKGRGRTRFPGITADASALGVNRATLFRVLTGTWRLPGLLARYKALKRGGAR